MTSTASLHFGPEWMRKPSRPAPVPPHPSALTVNTSTNGATANHNGIVTGPTPVTTGSPATTLGTHSSYSSLLTSTTPPPESRPDDTHPFRYSKEQMLAVWREGGGHGELGLEVERWPGIVREEADEPMGLKDFTAEERRLFSLPYNSDPPAMRRRGDSYSALNTTSPFDSTRDRTKLSSPMRDRYGVPGILGGPSSPATGVAAGGLGRRRKDENGNDVSLFRPRQLSLGTIATNNGPPSPSHLPASPGVGNGRPRLGGATFDGALGTETWGNSVRRRVSEPRISAAKPEDKLEGSWRSGGGFGTKDGIEEAVDEWEQELTPDLDGEPSIKTSVTEGSTHTPSASRPDSGASGHISPEPVDPLKVQWQYKDPTGQIQGPFAATVMQAWFESGYFAEDLLLRRLDADDAFDALADYRRRVIPPATEQNLFISPIATKDSLAALPPGLAPLISTPLSAVPPSPFSQMNGSAPRSAQGASPGPQYSSYAPSPTTSGFGVQENIGGDANAIPVAGSAADVEKQRRERDEFFRTLREKELAAQNLNGGGGGPQSPGPVFGGFAGAASLRSGLRVATNPGDSLPQSSQTFQSQSPLQPVQQSPFGMGVSPFNSGTFPGSVTLQHDPVIASPTNNIASSSPWNNNPQHSRFDSHPSANGLLPTHNDAPSPWNSIIGAIPYDAQPPMRQAPPIHNAWHQGGFPAQSPTVREQPGFGIGLAGMNQFTHQPQPSLSYFNAQANQALPDELVTFTSPPAQPSQSEQAIATGVQTLTIDETPSAAPESELSARPPATPQATSAAAEKDSSPSDVPEDASVSSTLVADTPVPTVSSKAKSSQPDAPKESKNSSKNAEPQPLVETSLTAAPSANLPAKPAWSVGVFDDKLPSSMSLRQIQDAEAKKSAEQKKLEKERAKASAASATSVATPTSQSSTSILDTTTSWGLPQVGRAATSTPTATSSPSLANGNTASAGGVWTSKAPQNAKKSMKEIQEEEERRKKEAGAAASAREAQATMAAAAVKRGYADSAKAVGSSAPSPTPNSPWTTVGANGKPSGALAPTPLNPTRTASPNSAAPRTNTPASNVTKQQAKSSTPAKTVEEPPSPSLEFVKWMREALKGLTGVNLEDFLPFLLQFPLEPSSSDLELISDTVYSYSSTLDGRRFAAEFVNKRKADAVNAKSSQAKSGTSSSHGRASLADVVKTQPKPAQTDLGYKVVNKKKGKGGRSGNGN